MSMPGTAALVSLSCRRYTEEEIEVETLALRKQLEAEGVESRKDK